MSENYFAELGKQTAAETGPKSRPSSACKRYFANETLREAYLRSTREGRLPCQLRHDVPACPEIQEEIDPDLMPRGGITMYGLYWGRSSKCKRI